jgi:uncharacterized membrane protein
MNMQSFLRGVSVACAVGASGCLVEGDAVYAPSATSSPPVDTDAAPIEETPTFAEVEPILSARCGACHGDAPLPGLVPFPDYARAAALVERIVARIQAGTMPPSGLEPLTSEERTLVEAWAEGGAPE